jgi:hypothetical protein
VSLSFLLPGLSLLPGTWAAICAGGLLFSKSLAFLEIFVKWRWQQQQQQDLSCEGGRQDLEGEGEFFFFFSERGMDVFGMWESQ